MPHLMSVACRRDWPLPPSLPLASVREDVMELTSSLGGNHHAALMFSKELFNLTEEDLDYYLNYTVLLHSVGGTLALPKDPRVIGAEDDLGGIVEDDYAGCGLGLHKIRRSVHLIHGFLSLFICLAGCLANVVNIMVLSRRELRRTAINRILCSLAVADFLLMLEYIPFACHMYLFPGRSLESFYSYSWAVFVLFHAHFTLVAHTISIWLTLSLAFWRYEVLKNGRHHQRRKSGRRCHQERCTRTIIMAYIGSIMLCIPSFVLFGIEEQQITVINNNGTSSSSFVELNQTINEDPLLQNTYDGFFNTSSTFIYKVNLNPIAKNYDGLIHKAHLWAYSVVMKLGPCLVLTLLTCWLVRRLWEAEKHHQTLTMKLSNNQQQTDGEELPVSTRAAILNHDINNQVSLTQQLEMRQLNSAMNQSGASSSAVDQHKQQQIPIIVTEPIAAASGATNNFPGTSSETIVDESAEAADVVQHMVSAGTLTVGAAAHKSSGSSTSRFRRRTSTTILDCSSYVGEATHDPDDNKMLETIIVADDGPTIAVGQGSTPVNNRNQVTVLNHTKSIRHKHQTDRTTRMLVAVLLLFLITEIPQGIMALLSGILGRQFFTRCYSTGMGEILDLLALLNSAINFLLYCSMSRQFRRAARAQFRSLGLSFLSLFRCGGSGGGETNSDSTVNINSPVHCFHFRLKFQPQQLPTVNVSPSNPTRCTQL